MYVYVLCRFHQPQFGFQEAALCIMLLHFKVEDVFVYRYTATANEKRAASCEVAESAQQTRAGRQEYFPCAQ